MGLRHVAKLKDTGPLAALKRLRNLRTRGLWVDVICTGKIIYGGDIVKVLGARRLGCWIGETGRPSII